MQDEKLKYLYIDFNSYFASVEQQLDPALRGKPVAVVPLDNTDATCAIAASYEAKAFGIKTGTPVYEAKKLCKDLICIQASHEKYVSFHHRLLEVIDKYIPVEKICSIDECACELQGIQQTPEGAAELAKQIKQGIAQNVGEYIKSSIGISSNIFLAKVASNLQKPDGLTILHPKDAPIRLSNYPLDFIPGIGRNMLKRLYDNRIFNFEQLYELSPKRMRKIWHSVAGERYWYMLRGVELPEEPTTKRTVGHSHMLAPELRPTPRAKQVARRLLCKAASRLRRLGYYANEIHLSVRVENGPRLSAHKKFYRACDTFTLLHEMYELWDELVKYRPHKIKKVSVSLFGLVPNEAVQPELLDVINPEKKHITEKHEILSKAMDKINARYGRDSIVVGGLPEATHRFSGTKVAFTRIPEIQEFYE